MKSVTKFVFANITTRDRQIAIFGFKACKIDKKDPLTVYVRL